jgi:hypothetical protein
MNGGMVEVEGRSLNAMPSNVLLKTLEDRREQRAKNELPAEVTANHVISQRIASEDKV